MQITSKGIRKKFLSFFNRDTEYWNHYYLNNPPKSQDESLFAKFVSKYTEMGKRLVDLGCGNGRDSLFFHNIGLEVCGVDASESVIKALNKFSNKSLTFLCGNFIVDERLYKNKYDYYYSRFTIHAIDKEGEKKLLKNVFNSLVEGGAFFIEVRSINDEKFGKGEKVGKNAYLLDGHYRRFININEMLAELIKVGFSIKYAEEAKGFAPYKDEDSYIIRIVAEKKCQ